MSIEFEVQGHRAQITRLLPLCMGDSILQGPDAGAILALVRFDPPLESTLSTRVIKPTRHYNTRDELIAEVAKGILHNLDAERMIKDYRLAREAKEKELSGLVAKVSQELGLEDVDAKV